MTRLTLKIGGVPLCLKAQRLDADVLAWLQDQGKGYHSRINAILRAYYEAHQDRAKLG